MMFESRVRTHVRVRVDRGRRRERIGSGTAARAARRQARPAGRPRVERPGLDRRPGLRGPGRGRAQGAGEGSAHARHRGALRCAGAALGERQGRAARRPPGDGRGRQGLGDQARDVGRQPAGRAGRLVQEAVGRRSSTTTSCGASRRRSPSAGASASSTARTTRRSSRSRCTPSGSSRSGCRPASATSAFWQERYEDINAFERHLDRTGTKIVKFFLHVSKDVAEEALPRAARHAGQGMEVQRRRCRGARPLGRLHRARSRTR